MSERYFELVSPKRARECSPGLALLPEGNRETVFLQSGLLSRQRILSLGASFSARTPCACARFGAFDSPMNRACGRRNQSCCQGARGKAESSRLEQNEVLCDVRRTVEQRCRGLAVLIRSIRPTVQFDSASSRVELRARPAKIAHLIYQS